jgi:hypothetical protein
MMKRSIFTTGNVTAWLLVFMASSVAIFAEAEFAWAAQEADPQYKERVLDFVEKTDEFFWGQTHPDKVGEFSDLPSNNVAGPDSAKVTLMEEAKWLFDNRDKGSIETLKNSADEDAAMAGEIANLTSVFYIFDEYIWSSSPMDAGGPEPFPGANDVVAKFKFWKENLAKTPEAKRTVSQIVPKAGSVVAVGYKKDGVVRYLYVDDKNFLKASVSNNGPQILDKVSQFVIMTFRDKIGLKSKDAGDKNLKIDDLSQVLAVSGYSAEMRKEALQPSFNSSKFSGESDTFEHFTIEEVAQDDGSIGLKIKNEGIDLQTEMASDGYLAVDDKGFLGTQHWDTETSKMVSNAEGTVFFITEVSDFHKILTQAREMSSVSEKIGKYQIIAGQTLTVDKIKLLVREVIEMAVQARLDSEKWEKLGNARVPFEQLIETIVARFSSAIEMFINLEDPTNEFTIQMLSVSNSWKDSSGAFKGIPSTWNERLVKSLDRAVDFLSTLKFSDRLKSLIVFSNRLTDQNIDVFKSNCQSITSAEVLKEAFEEDIKKLRTFFNNLEWNTAFISSFSGVSDTAKKAAADVWRMSRLNDLQITFTFNDYRLNLEQMISGESGEKLEADKEVQALFVRKVRRLYENRAGALGDELDSFEITLRKAATNQFKSNDQQLKTWLDGLRSFVEQNRRLTVFLSGKKILTDLEMTDLFRKINDLVIIRDKAKAEQFDIRKTVALLNSAKKQYFFNIANAENAERIDDAVRKLLGNVSYGEMSFGQKVTELARRLSSISSQDVTGFIGNSRALIDEQIDAVPQDISKLKEVLRRALNHPDIKIKTDLPKTNLTTPLLDGRVLSTSAVEVINDLAIRLEAGTPFEAIFSVLLSLYSEVNIDVEEFMNKANLLVEQRSGASYDAVRTGSEKSLIDESIEMLREAADVKLYEKKDELKALASMLEEYKKEAKIRYESTAAPFNERLFSLKVADLQRRFDTIVDVTNQKVIDQFLTDLDNTLLTESLVEAFNKDLEMLGTIVENLKWKTPFRNRAEFKDDVDPTEIDSAKIDTAIDAYNSLLSYKFSYSEYAEDFYEFFRQTTSDDSVSRQEFLLKKAKRLLDLRAEATEQERSRLQESLNIAKSSKLTPSIGSALASMITSLSKPVPYKLMFARLSKFIDGRKIFNEAGSPKDSQIFIDQVKDLDKAQDRAREENFDMAQLTSLLEEVASSQMASSSIAQASREQLAMHLASLFGEVAYEEMSFGQKVADLAKRLGRKTADSQSFMKDLALVMSAQDRLNGTDGDLNILKEIIIRAEKHPSFDALNIKQLLVYEQKLEEGIGFEVVLEYLASLISKETLTESEKDDFLSKLRILVDKRSDVKFNTMKSGNVLDTTKSLLQYAVEDIVWVAKAVHLSDRMGEIEPLNGTLEQYMETAKLAYDEESVPFENRLFSVRIADLQSRFEEISDQTDDTEMTNFVNDLESCLRVGTDISPGDLAEAFEKDVEALRAIVENIKWKTPFRQQHGNNSGVIDSKIMSYINSLEHQFSYTAYAINFQKTIEKATIKDSDSAQGLLMSKGKRLFDMRADATPEELLVLQEWLSIAKESRLKPVFAAKLTPMVEGLNRPVPYRLIFEKLKRFVATRKTFEKIGDVRDSKLFLDQVAILNSEKDRANQEGFDLDQLAEFLTDVSKSQMAIKVADQAERRNLMQLISSLRGQVPFDQMSFGQKVKDISRRLEDRISLDAYLFMNDMAKIVQKEVLVSGLDKDVDSLKKSLEKALFHPRLSYEQVETLKTYSEQLEKGIDIHTILASLEEMMLQESVTREDLDKFISRSKNLESQKEQIEYVTMVISPEGSQTNVRFIDRAIEIVNSAATYLFPGGELNETLASMEKYRESLALVDASKVPFEDMDLADKLDYLAERLVNLEVIEAPRFMSDLESIKNNRIDASMAQIEEANNLFVATQWNEAVIESFRGEGPKYKGEAEAQKAVNKIADMFAEKVTYKDRYNDLVARTEAEILTDDEQKEFLGRATALAQIRGSDVTKTELLATVAHLERSRFNKVRNYGDQLGELVEQINDEIKKRDQQLKDGDIVSFRNRLDSLKERLKTLTEEGRTEFFSDMTKLVNDRVDAVENDIEDLEDWISGEDGTLRTNTVVFFGEGLSVLDDLLGVLREPITYMEMAKNFTALIKDNEKFSTEHKRIFMAKLKLMVDQRWKASDESFDLTYVERLLEYVLFNRLQSDSKTSNAVTAYMDQLKRPYRGVRPGARKPSFADRIADLKSKIASLTGATLPVFLSASKSLVDDRVDATNSQLAELKTWLSSERVQRHEAVFFSPKKVELAKIIATIDEPVPYAKRVENLNEMIRSYDSFDAKRKQVFSAKVEKLVEERGRAASEDFDINEVVDLIEFAILNRFTGDYSSIEYLNGKIAEIKTEALAGTEGGMTYAERIDALRLKFSNLTSASLKNFVDSVSELAKERVDGTEEEIDDVYEWIKSPAVQIQSKVILFNNEERARLNAKAENFKKPVSYVAYVENITRMVRDNIRFNNKILGLFFTKAQHLVDTRWRAEDENYDLDTLNRLFLYVAGNQFSDNDDKPNAQKITALANELLRAMPRPEGETAEFVSYAERIVAKRNEFMRYGSSVQDRDKVAKFLEDMSEFINDRVDGTAEDSKNLKEFLVSEVKYHPHVYNRDLEAKVDSLVERLVADVTFEELLNNLNKMLQIPAFSKDHKDFFMSKLKNLVKNRHLASDVQKQSLTRMITFAKINKFRNDDENLKLIDEFIVEFSSDSEMTLDRFIDMQEAYVKEFSPEQLASLDAATKTSWLGKLRRLVNNVDSSTTEEQVNRIKTLLMMSRARIFKGEDAMINSTNEYIKNIDDFVKPSGDQMVQDGNPVQGENPVQEEAPA